MERKKNLRGYPNTLIYALMSICVQSNMSSLSQSCPLFLNGLTVHLCLSRTCLLSSRKLVYHNIFRMHFICLIGNEGTKSKTVFVPVQYKKWVESKIYFFVSQSTSPTGLQEHKISVWVGVCSAQTSTSSWIWTVLRKNEILVLVSNYVFVFEAISYTP